MTVLDDALDAVAAVLEPGGWPVLLYPDGLTPPCFTLVWRGPWLTLKTACLWTAHLDVRAVAGRLEPETGVATLNELTVFAMTALAAARWPVKEVPGPIQWPVGGVDYLAVRIPVDLSVTIAP